VSAALGPDVGSDVEKGLEVAAVAGTAAREIGTHRALRVRQKLDGLNASLDGAPNQERDAAHEDPTRDCQGDPQHDAHTQRPRRVMPRFRVDRFHTVHFAASARIN